MTTLWGEMISFELVSAKVRATFVENMAFILVAKLTVSVCSWVIDGMLLIFAAIMTGTET